jgi:hypothetical protein
MRDFQQRQSKSMTGVVLVAIGIVTAIFVAHLFDLRFEPKRASSVIVRHQ